MINAPEHEEGKNPPNNAGASVRADREVKLSRVIPRRKARLLLGAKTKGGLTFNDQAGSLA